jgi:hypothetical protein
MLFKKERRRMTLTIFDKFNNKKNFYTEEEVIELEKDWNNYPDSLKLIQFSKERYST